MAFKLLLKGAKPVSEVKSADVEYVDQKSGKTRVFKKRVLLVSWQDTIFKVVPAFGLDESVFQNLEGREVVRLDMSADVPEMSIR